MGEGEVFYNNTRQATRTALKAAKVQAIELIAKEGLALINGTQFSTAASLRGHQGQIDVATAMRALMEGSEIRDSHREDDTRVQDPYCIRCQPQVTGACMEILRQVAATLQTEANAVTDNPLVIPDDNHINGGKVLSGGNFHAEPVAFAADQIAIAIAENSGFMVAEITTAALMSENKHLANPCSTDSTPTSANQEDHVSMAAHGALRLSRMNNNLLNILAIELLCAARGIEFRGPLKTSAPLSSVIT